MIHSAKVANLCHSNGIKSGNKSYTFHLFRFFYTFVLHYSKQYYETTDYLLLILNDTDVFIGAAHLPDY